MRKRDTFYSDGCGGTSANGSVECDEDGNLLESPEYIGEEEFMKWREFGVEIVKDEKNRQWALGQWIFEGENMKDMAWEMRDQRFKNSVYKAAADITGYSVQTVKALAYVVRNVPVEVKDEFNVSFAHLKLVAKYDQAKQRDYLGQIERGRLNVTEARERLKFLNGETADRMSAADRRAKRITWHCDKLIHALDDHNLEATSQLIRATLRPKIKDTRRVLAEVFDE
ncbi:MAG TPA: hypothetical protein VGH37_10425 [Candidatus Acidoferrum sp.]|jgi:hypothetical protein